eukprot:6192564-Amphidinium_carterae.1
MLGGVCLVRTGGGTKDLAWDALAELPVCRTPGIMTWWRSTCTRKAQSTPSEFGQMHTGGDAWGRYRTTNGSKCCDVEQYLSIV